MHTQGCSSLLNEQVLRVTPNALTIADKYDCLVNRSHCDCDEAFYNCLRADRKSIVSVKVGTTYFNLLRPRCFRAVNPCKAGATSANR